MSSTVTSTVGKSSFLTGTESTSSQQSTSAGAQTSNSSTPLFTSSTNQATEASVSAQPNRHKHTTVIGIVISVVIAIILLTIAGIAILRRKQQQNKASGATIAVQPFVNDQKAVTTSLAASPFTNSERDLFSQITSTLRNSLKDRYHYLLRQLATLIALLMKTNFLTILWFNAFEILSANWRRLGDLLAGIAPSSFQMVKHRRPIIEEEVFRLLGH